MGLYRIAPQFTHYNQQASKMTDTVTIPRSEYEMIYKMIGERLGAPVDAVPTPSKVSKKAEKAEKKPRANTGVPTAWSEWTELMNKEHQAEIASYIVQRVASAEAGTLVYTADQNAVKLGRAVAGQPVPVKKAKIGAHLSWLKAYKAEHEADWLAFQTKWTATVICNTNLRQPRVQRATQDLCKDLEAIGNTTMCASTSWHWPFCICFVVPYPKCSKNVSRSHAASATTGSGRATVTVGSTSMDCACSQYLAVRTGVVACPSRASIKP